MNTYNCYLNAVADCCCDCVVVAVALVLVAENENLQFNLIKPPHMTM